MGCASSKRADGPEQVSNAEPQKQDDESVQSTTDTPQSDAPADDGVTIEVTTAKNVCCWAPPVEQQADGDTAEGFQGMQEASEDVAEPVVEKEENANAEVTKENEVSVDAEVQHPHCPFRIFELCAAPDANKDVEAANGDEPQFDEAAPVEAVVEDDAKTVNCDWSAMKFAPLAANNENKQENSAVESPDQDPN